MWSGRMLGMEHEMQNDQQSIVNSLRDKGPEAWRAYPRPLEEGQPMTALSMLVVYPYAERVNDFET